MQENSSEYNIPSFARPKSYIFEPTNNNQFSAIYQELNEIAEEIERCRLKNC